MAEFSDLAYLFHSRPYTDSKVILEFFTKSRGRISGVFRLPSKKRPFKPQPFCPYALSWLGRGDLKTLTVIDAIAAPVPLAGKCMFCGMYLNELLLRLLQKEDPHEHLFQHYAATLSHLSRADQLEPVLRAFEFGLLEELGYGIDFSLDSSGQRIGEESSYLFSPGEGFVRCSGAVLKEASFQFKGKDLLRIALGDIDTTSAVAAKRLSRLMLAPLLGSKPLKSRELFR